MGWLNHLKCNNALKMKRKLLNISVILLTIILWGLQMLEKLPEGWFKTFLNTNTFQIASFAGGIVIVFHLLDLYYGKETVRRTWLERLFAHIINEHLGGNNYTTKISMLRPKYGYQILLPYIYYCFVLCFFDNFVKGMWKTKLKNIPIHLRTKYLVVYARYSYPKQKKSHAHFRITDIENHYNGIAEKCFRDGISLISKSVKVSDIAINQDFFLLLPDERNKIEKYMKDFYISNYYYCTLQNINSAPNNIIAVPIVDDIEIWGVMTIDINGSPTMPFDETLKELAENYAQIISQTLNFI